MNMISQIRQRVKANGTAEITPEEFDQLQTEWIMRAGAEDLVLAEREACAKVCEGLKRGGESLPPDSPRADLNRQCMSCAEAIRMRSNVK